MLREAACGSGPTTPSTPPAAHPPRRPRRPRLQDLSHQLAPPPHAPPAGLLVTEVTGVQRVTRGPPADADGGSGAGASAHSERDDLEQVRAHRPQRRRQTHSRRKWVPAGPSAVGTATLTSTRGPGWTPGEAAWEAAAAPLPPAPRFPHVELRRAARGAAPGSSSPHGRPFGGRLGVWPSGLRTEERPPPRAPPRCLRLPDATIATIGVAVLGDRRGPTKCNPADSGSSPSCARRAVLAHAGPSGAAGDRGQASGPPRPCPGHPTSPALSLQLPRSLAEAVLPGRGGEGRGHHTRG